MFAALTAFFRCLAIALRVWGRIKSYELENRIRLDNAADENEIERLRSAASAGVDPAGNTLRADRLRERIDRRNLIPSNLYTEDIDTAAGGAGADPGRDLHTPSA